MKSFALLAAIVTNFITVQQCPVTTSEDTSRFPIAVQGKIGFINSRGEIVILPQFEDAHEFSEGLCAVRIKGRYGFINTDGTVCITPSYDYATEFSEGLALVFLDGKPLFINQSGERPFATNYASMCYFRQGRSLVKTYSGKMGLIDPRGKLIIDTVYKYIGPFEDGLAIVYGLNHYPYGSDDKKETYEVSVINETGKMLTPYGKFTEIEHYSENYFKVTWPVKGKKDESDEGFIDRQGQLVYTLPWRESSWIQGGVHNGILRATLYKGRKNSKSYSTNDSYEGYFTIDGEEVYVRKSTDAGEDFSENFAFVRKDEGNYSFINRRGEVIGKNYDAIIGGGFKNGMALVETDEGWGVIDTTGNFILAPRFEQVHEAGIVDGFIFFEDSVSEDSDYPRYGMADLTGKVIVQPMFQYFSPEFKNGLLKVWVDDRAAYIDKSGKLIWKEEVWVPEKSQPLNIDYMNRGYFYANYNYTGHGNSPSRAEAEKIIPSLYNFPEAVLSVTAYPEHNYDLGEKIKGMIVHVANTTSDTIRFNAQDSRLYMKTQAKDATGVWRDIEYLPNSWCGNSYHHVSLPEGHYWTFVAPVYQGTIPVKLRIELTYVDPTDKPDETQKRSRGLDWSYRDKRELVIYSNEFDGSINPAQFWRKPEYHPLGIMDPYNE